MNADGRGRVRGRPRSKWLRQSLTLGIAYVRKSANCSPRLNMYGNSVPEMKRSVSWAAERGIAESGFCEASGEEK